MKPKTKPKHCYKLKFPSEIAAKRALRIIFQKVYFYGHPYRNEKYFYKCLNCGNYHLTSQEQMIKK